jgi:hypothetical protein
MCGKGMRVNGEVKANGPLANVYSGGDVRVSGRLIITGDLLLTGNFINSGQIEISGEIKKLSEPITIPSVDPSQFLKEANYLFTDENGGSVYEYDDAHNLIRKITGGRYTDPSGAKWRFHSQGPNKNGFWAIEGDKPSSLAGTVYFKTDLRLPDHILNIDGKLVVEGNISDSGELYVKTKPDEWAVVVNGDLFLRNKTDVWGKIYVGGNLKLPDTAGTEPIPIAKYHDKGKVIVKGECDVNGRFHINHLELVQRVSEIILITDEQIEGLKWKETVLIGDYQEGEPGIAIIKYESPSGNEVSVIMGDSEDYGTDLMYGLPYSAILNIAYQAKRELAINLKRIVFIPPMYFVGITAYGDGVILYPKSSLFKWRILPPSVLDDAFNILKEMRMDPEERQARKEEWKFFREKYAHYYSPYSPGWCDGHKNWVSVYKDANKIPFDKGELGQEFNLSWNFEQEGASCAPTASAQIFAYNRDVLQKECISKDNTELATKLAEAMGTEKTDDEYWGDTYPWDIDEGIEKVASYYGYKTSSNWTGFEVTSSGLWHTYFDFIKEYRIPQIFELGEWWWDAFELEWMGHAMIVVGALRYWWDWWCATFAKHWIYIFDNRDVLSEEGEIIHLHRYLMRFRLDEGDFGIVSEILKGMFLPFGGSIWEGTTVTDFEGKYAYFRDIDGDGYGSLLSGWISSCHTFPPSGFSWVFSDCNDRDSAIHPGAPELCDGKDNNCSGDEDEGCDDDGDDWCDVNMITIGSPPVCPNGGGDCLDYTDYDYAKYVHPGATEYCDNVDNDCDGTVDEECISLPEVACEVISSFCPGICSTVRPEVKEIARINLLLILLLNLCYILFQRYAFRRK